MTDKTPSLTVHASADQLLDLAYGVHGRAQDSPVWEHVRSCPVCEPRLRELAADKERGTVEWETLKHRAPSQAPSRPGRSAGRSLAALAAALAVASLALLLRPGAGIEPLELSPPGNALVLRSQDPAASDQLAAGLEAYGQRDLDRVVAVLSREQGHAGRDLVRRLYLGSALALQGKSDRALAVVSTLDPASLPAPWSAELRWTLAAVYADLGREAESREQLEALAAGESPLSERAREALGR